MALSRHIETLKTAVLEGGPGFAQIAVTNDCNANCGFCNFAREKRLPKAYTPTGRLLGAVDILYEKGIRYIVFVGGEPLLHRGLEEAVAHAHGRGIEPIICTNGWLLDEARLVRLRDAGVRNVIISVDAPDSAVHDANRGLPGLSERVREANRAMRKLGMHATASVTISRLVGDFGRLVDFVREAGFRDITFSYPLNELHSTYLSFSDSELVGFSKEELIGIFGTLKGLKKSFRVLNPSAGMDEMVRFLKGEPARFPCLAGYKYFFLDWDLDVYRCHFMKERICAVEDFGKAAPIRDGCARCMIDCYRDPSVLQYSAVSVSDSLYALRHGRVAEAMKRIFDFNNLLSLKAVVEELGLVVRYGSHKS